MPVRFIFVSILYLLKTQKVGVQRRSCNFSHRENDAVQIQPSLTNDKSGIQNKQTIFNILIKSLWHQDKVYKKLKYQTSFLD